MSKEAADMREAASTEAESDDTIGKGSVLMIISVAPTTKTPSKKSQYSSGDAVGQTDQGYFMKLKAFSRTCKIMPKMRVKRIKMITKATITQTLWLQPVWLASHAPLAVSHRLATPMPITSPRNEPIMWMSPWIKTVHQKQDNASGKN